MTRNAAARRRWERLGDAGLAVAAILGAVCIVLAVAAAVFDVRIVMFRTGSMSPTIPAGSAAVVHGIPAADIRVGDVIMVDRAGKLPVTHRVVGIETVPGSADARSITMRGDANAVDDPAPYEVREVRRVVLSFSGVAPVLVALGSPWVLGTITLAATALIIVVFWPKRRRPAAAPADDSLDDSTTVVPPAPDSRRARRLATSAKALTPVRTGTERA